ncbi:hypothetical protein LOC67_18355 [Stieleria sp. JC731]|uniref:hypothetical protein n=1 Tax=Pirellulaceae TaxID=2691357 RepID=UPI001E64CEF2|nr:hypothetical protein [Stieleria sp. JC731]MCC9602518.1 hypothetical protein [Stieleria sp. JC731]
MCRVWWLALLLCGCSICLTIESGKGFADETTDKTADERSLQKEARLKFIQATAESFQLALRDAPEKRLSLDEQPLLRYTNPVRNFFTDGVVLLWRYESEPVLMGAVSVRGNGAVFCEFTALSSLQMSGDLGLRRQWTPEKTTQVDVPIDVDGPATPDLKRQALLMRRLIRRFSVWMYEAEDENNKQKLRLLSNPLVQWTDEKTGSSMMCFGFTETNDPEGLVILRYNSKPESGQATWTYTLSRMTSRPLTFELDNQPVYEVKPYWGQPQSNTDSYLERRLKDYEE